MADKPSVADDFVQVMGLIKESFQPYDRNDPNWRRFEALKDVAVSALRDGISQAARITYAARDLRVSLDAAKAKGE